MKIRMKVPNEEADRLAQLLLEALSAQDQAELAAQEFHGVVTDLGEDDAGITTFELSFQPGPRPAPPEGHQPPPVSKKPLDTAPEEE